MDDIIKNTTFPRRWSFRELDFFSGGTSVKIKSDERVKSFLGALISLTLYTLLGLSIYYFLNEFLDTTNPKIQLNSQLSDQPSVFKAENSGLGGLYFFFLVSNPSKEAGKSEPYYLSYDTIKKYYDYKSTYDDVTYQVEGKVTKKVQSKTREVKMVSCSTTSWFATQEFKATTENNTMTRFVIENFALCPVFEEGMDIYGDDQTLSSARYKFTLSPCTTEGGECDEAFTKLTDVAGQSTIVGTFQPIVQSSDKESPFKYEINLDNVVPMGLLLNSKVVLSMKNSEVQTDKGLIISNVVSESRAAVNALRLTYDPTITVGDFLPDVVSDNLNFGVRYVSEEPPLSIRIVSSRVTNQMTRTYSTVPELIGNIGGTVEAIVMLFLVILHWMENLLLDTRMNYVVGKFLKLPHMVKPSHSLTSTLYSKCCKKRNKDLAFKAQSSEVVGEIVDKALSIEQMSYNQILLRFILENSFPDEIRQLVPAIYVMKEVLEGLKEEKHLFEPKKAFAKDAEGSADLRDQRRKDASEASKYPLSQGETDNHWKSIDTKPFKVQDIELAAIQESHLKPLGNLQANQSFSSVAQENSTTKKLNYEVKVPKRFIKQKNQESKTENGLQLEANPHMDGQQTPSDNLIASSVPEGEKSSKPAEPVTPKPKTPLARNAIHRMTTMWGQDLKKTTVYPPEPELVNRPSGMGNRSGSVTLGNSENTTKLLEAYQVMRQNAEVEDEFQVWRVNLLAIIDEFVLITGVKSPEDLFKEEEDLSLAQRICRCLKGKSKAPSPPLKA